MNVKTETTEQDDKQCLGESGSMPLLDCVYPNAVEINFNITEIHISRNTLLLKLRKEKGSFNFMFSRGGTGDLWYDKAEGGFSSYCIYHRYKDYSKFKKIIHDLSTDEYLILGEVDS